MTGFSFLDVLTSCKKRPGADLLDLIADVQHGREVSPAERYAWTTATPELDLVRLLIASEKVSTTKAADIFAQIPATVPPVPAVKVPPMPSRPPQGVVDLTRFVAAYSGEATVRGAFARGFADVTDTVSGRDHAGVCVAALVRGAVGTYLQTPASFEMLEQSLSAWRAAASGCAAWVFDVCVWFDRRDADVASTLQWLARYPHFAAPVLLPDMSALVPGEQLRNFKLPPVVTTPDASVTPWAEHLADPASALRIPSFLPFQQACTVARRPPPSWDLAYAVAAARLAGRPDVVRTLTEPFQENSAHTLAAAGTLLALASHARDTCTPFPSTTRPAVSDDSPVFPDTKNVSRPATDGKVPTGFPIGPRLVSSINEMLASCETRLRVPLPSHDRATRLAAEQAAQQLLQSRAPRTAVVAAVVGAYRRATPGDIAATLRAAGDTVNDETVRSALAKLVSNGRVTYVTYGVYAPGSYRSPKTLPPEAFRQVPPPGVPLAEAVRAVADIDPTVTARQVAQVLSAHGWTTSAQYVAAPLRRYRAKRAHAALEPAPQRKATASSRLSTATTSSGPL